MDTTAQDACDGSTNGCADLLKSAGTICRAAGANATCDPADICDGSRKSCPALHAPSGTSCGSGMSCSGAGQCR